MTGNALLIRGTFVQCLSGSELAVLEDHVVAVNELGIISSFGPAASSESILLLEDHANCVFVQIPDGSFLLPTFCDLHLHAPQFLYQGNGLHLPLMEWLDQYAFKAEERLDGDPTLARRVYTRLARRLKENGTGTVLLFGTIKEETNVILAQCMNSAGIRAFIGKLSMDQNSSPTYVEASSKESILSAESFVNAIHTSFPSPRLVEPVVTPRFVPTCSDGLLMGLGSLAQSRQLRVQSHLAESHDQMSAVLSERGDHDIDIFERSGLLSHRTVQAHCTFLAPASLTRLRDTGTSVAHCPLSNAYFSAEPFRLREALDLGVKVGLGTDVAGGYSLDVMNAMRQSVIVSRMRQGLNVMSTMSDESLSIDWIQSLYLATQGGAIALSLPVGMFEAGSAFDAQQISLWNPDTLEGIGSLDFFDNADMKLTATSIEKWWCLGDNRNRTAMWVQGMKV